VAKDSPSKLARGLFIFLGLVLLMAAWIWPQLPARGPARIPVTPELTGVLLDGYVYAWVLKTPNGAALVDAGVDGQGKQLLAELASLGVSPEQVHTVLLTHGHADHWGGAHLFPKARVVVGPGEAAVIRGEYTQKSLVGRLTRSTAKPPVPAGLEEVKDGDELNAGGETLRVIHVPGHTPGSVALQWRDLLFTGDALMRRRGGVGPAPALLNEDTGRARESLRALLQLPFTRTADGHTGLTENAKQKLREALE